MRRAVYLDSTIPSYLFDKRGSIRLYSDLTRKWWQEESENYDIMIFLYP
jgi:hypothetical protein